MAIQNVANAASQLINSSTNITIPVTVPGPLAMTLSQGYSINVWINANWGSSAVPRTGGAKSFVGIYGPAARTQGLTGIYYSNKTLTEPSSLVRLDSNINITLTGNASPGPGVNGAEFSVRWSGWYTPTTTSAYHYFRTNSDDGIRVYVNNVLVINNWTDHSATVNTSGAVNLTAGTAYPIVVEYYNQGGDAVLTLQTGIGTMMGGAPSTYAAIPNDRFATSAALPQTTTALQIGTRTGRGEISCWTYGGTPLVETADNVMAAWNNLWVNVCYTWDGNTHILYLNGAAVGSTTTEQIPGSLKYITINGYWPGSANETDNHYVDSYSLYSRVLHPNEVLTIYNADGARHGIWNGLVANYEFDELPDGVDANLIYDMTGGGANLLKVGAGASPKYSYQNSHADSNIRPPVST